MFPCMPFRCSMVIPFNRAERADLARPASGDTGRRPHLGSERLRRREPDAQVLRPPFGEDSTVVAILNIGRCVLSRQADLPRPFTAWRGDGRAIAKALKPLGYRETVGDDVRNRSRRPDSLRKDAGGLLRIESCGARNASQEFLDKTQHAEEKIIRRVNRCITGLTACKLS